MTCLTVIGGEDIWKERLSRAGFAILRMGGPCLNRKLINFCGIFFTFVCANSLYCGGPKTLLTDQHLLRTDLFFVTETSELRLAGLLMREHNPSPFVSISSISIKSRYAGT